MTAQQWSQVKGHPPIIRIEKMNFAIGRSGIRIAATFKRSKFTLPDLPYDFGELEPVVSLNQHNID